MQNTHTYTLLYSKADCALVDIHAVFTAWMSTNSDMTVVDVDKYVSMWA